MVVTLTNCQVESRGTARRIAGPLVGTLSMKSHTEYLSFKTKKHREHVHITPQVEAAIQRSGVREGIYVNRL